MKSIYLILGDFLVCSISPHGLEADKVEEQSVIIHFRGADRYGSYECS